MRRFVLLFGAVVLMLGQAVSQDPVKPGKEHEFFKELEGDWDFSADGGIQGKSTYKMVHGGLWLESKIEMMMPSGKFTGQGLDGYDPVKKKYVAIWVDSMSAAPVVLEGDMDSATKTITMLGKGPNETGQIVDYKMVTHYKDKDTHHFKMWMGKLTGDP
ncbi:MAG: DUF1579 family protein, partial [Pirellula sp.]